MHKLKTTNYNNNNNNNQNNNNTIQFIKTNKIWKNNEGTHNKTTEQKKKPTTLVYRKYIGQLW